MTDHAYEQPQGHSHAEAGPWLQDARRILNLIEGVGQQYAAQAQGQAQGQAQATRADQAPAGECAWCPLCQALSVARHSAPDLLDRVAELASGLAATIRATTPQAPDDPAQAAPPDPVQQRGAHAAPPAPSTRPETVRIDITD